MNDRAVGIKPPGFSISQVEFEISKEKRSLVRPAMDFPPKRKIFDFFWSKNAAEQALPAAPSSPFETIRLNEFDSKLNFKTSSNQLKIIAIKKML